VERYLKNQGKRKTGSRSKNGDYLTIMAFKQAGKVRRFTLSCRLMVCASLFLLFYVVATIYFTNRYFDTRRANRTQEAKIAQLSRELLKTTRGVERSKQRIALLDDYIRESKEQGSESTGDYTESPLPTIVDIEELKIKRDGSTIDVTFRIVNRQSNEGPIGGYVFVLASEKDSDQSEVLVYPSSPLEDGMPANYRSGHRFLIQNFMSISSKLRSGKANDNLLILKILVYGRGGTLILKRVVEV